MKRELRSYRNLRNFITGALLLQATGCATLLGDTLTQTLVPTILNAILSALLSGATAAA